MRCRGVHGLANPAYLSHFLFPGLPCVAPYCVQVRVKLGSSRVGSRWITRRRFLCKHMRFLDILSSPKMRVDIGTGCRQTGKFTPASATYSCHVPTCV